VEGAKRTLSMSPQTTVELPGTVAVSVAVCVAVCVAVMCVAAVVCVARDALPVSRVLQ